MKRDDILRELKMLDDLGVPRMNYALTYGGALVMNGVKEETSDVDVSVDASVKSYLESKGYLFQEFDNGNKKGWKLSLSENLDLHTHDTLMTPLVTEIIDGYCVQTTDSVLIEKMMRGRDKDIRNVQEILERIPGKHVMI